MLKSNMFNKIRFLKNMEFIQKNIRLNITPYLFVLVLEIILEGKVTYNIYFYIKKIIQFLYFSIRMCKPSRNR